MNMAPRECQQTARIEALERKVDGNGQPGVVSRTAVLELQSETHTSNIDGIVTRLTRLERMSWVLIGGVSATLGNDLGLFSLVKTVFLACL